MSELPSQILLAEMPGSDTTEKWKSYLDHIYGIFRREVAEARLEFQGLPIKCRYHEPYDGKHFSFWHLISEGRVEQDRTPDLDRCARISWVAWMIRNSNDSTQVRSWETERSTKRGRKTRVVLWLFQHDYAVILEKRADFFLLITTYCILPHQKKNFEREWKAWNGCT